LPRPCVLAQDWAKVSCDSSVFRINFDGTLSPG